MRLFGFQAVLGVAVFTGPSLTSAPSLIEPGSRDNSGECECYLLSGPEAGYFQYHRFYDFRNIANDGSNDYAIAPPLVTDVDRAGGQNVTCSYLNSTAFQQDWNILNGVEEAHSSVPSVNSASNIYISRNISVEAGNSTYLTLRTNRLSNFMSIAELDNNEKNMLHSSIRIRLRIMPNDLIDTLAPISDRPAVDNATAGSNSSHPVDPGAVLGFFTYQSDVQESDIEILTLDPTTHVRYSNQPDYHPNTGPVPGASTEMSLPAGDDWTEWLNYRLDWFPRVSRWYVDEQLQLEKTLNVPKKPSGVILNLWGDGEQWSGNMSIGGQVVAGVEWIEMVFNISGNVNGPKKRDNQVCQVACNVDGVKNIGFPEVAYNATANGGIRVRPECGVVSVLPVIIAVLTMVFGRL